MLQKSDEDASKAFTGEKSELFSSKKERGIEVWIKYIFEFTYTAWLL